MTSIDSLPTEIILKIVKLLYDLSGSIPIYGSNAIWTAPKHPDVPASVYLQQAFLDRARGNEDEDGDDENEGRYGRYARKTISVSGAYYPLKSLRVTSKYFNQIVTPFLYKELNTFPLLSEMSGKGYRQFKKYLLEPYWNHITTVCLYVDMVVYKSMYSTNWAQKDETHNQTLSALSVCKNVRSLGLYYYNILTDFTPLVVPVLDLLVNYQLRSLGILSHKIVNEMDSEPEEEDGLNGPEGFLKAILSSDKAASVIEMLDIAVEMLPNEVYGLIHSRLKNLRSLSIRQPLKYGEEKLNDVWSTTTNISIQNGWPVLSTLTTLRLIQCEGIEVPYLPTLLSQFTSLQHVWIVDCGPKATTTPPMRLSGTPGPDAPNSRQNPLQTFWIERMSLEALLHLGIITTIHLTLINLSGDIASTFIQDPEAFPHLEVLHTPPRVASAFESASMSAQALESEAIGESNLRLELAMDIYRRRGIKLRGGAQRTIACIEPYGCDLCEM